MATRGIKITNSRGARLYPFHLVHPVSSQDEKSGVRCCPSLAIVPFWSISMLTFWGSQTSSACPFLLSFSFSAQCFPSRLMTANNIWYIWTLPHNELQSHWVPEVSPLTNSPDLRIISMWREWSRSKSVEEDGWPRRENIRGGGESPSLSCLTKYMFLGQNIFLITNCGRVTFTVTLFLPWLIGRISLCHC